GSALETLESLGIDVSPRRRPVLIDGSAHRQKNGVAELDDLARVAGACRGPWTKRTFDGPGECAGIAIGVVVAGHEGDLVRVDTAVRQDARELLELCAGAVFGEVAGDDQVIEPELLRFGERTHGSANTRFGVDGPEQGQVTEPDASAQAAASH